MLLERETRLAQGPAVVGQFADGESGEMAEGPVEAPDQRTGDETAKPAGGDCEFRDQPEGLRGNGFADGCSEGLNLFRGQAIEEKVRNDEVVRWVCRLPLAGVSAECADTGGVGAGAAQQGRKHCGACVHCVDLNGGGGGGEGGGESGLGG